jgi:biofilm PGA synthesis N-glycosyltransferase PgaC
MVAETLFWVAATGVLYIYVGYPLWIGLAARLRPRPVERGTLDGAVSVILAVYNEAGRIGEKLESIVASDPTGRIREVLVGSDGSTDDTEAKAGALGDPRIRVTAFPWRRGKAACLNDLVLEARGDFLLFTDARQEIQAGAVDALLRNFQDPSVAVVSGELVFTPSSQEVAAGRGMGIYWQYENWIRNQEARVHSVPGASGALYMARRSAYRSIPPATILDDVAIPMQAVVGGGRCLIEPAAVATDTASQSGRAEAIRKRRTIGGVVQLLGLFPGWLLPWKNPIWFQYVSHKVLRLFSPFFLLAALGASAHLSVGSAYYRFALAFQIVFYALAFMGFIWSGRKLGPLFSAPYLFTALNVTTLLALADALTGRLSGTWEPADPDA